MSVSKNCQGWAEYEAPGTSDGAALCNGGWHNGSQKNYRECPSKELCKSDTNKALYGIRPVYGSSTGLTQVAPTPLGGSFLGRPRTLPVIQQQSPTQPYQVQPPPYVDHRSLPKSPYLDHHHQDIPLGPSQNHVPAFMPGEDEGVFERLGKNIIQGAFGEAGRQIFELARRVNFWPKRRKE